MNYVVAGYSIVLGILFLYAVQLLWRRRKLTRAALRVESFAGDSSMPAGGDGTGVSS
jgi:hypothetical protein